MNRCCRQNILWVRKAARSWSAAPWALLVASQFLGCDSCNTLAPDEINASWDQLEYLTGAAQDTLRIDENGAICLLGAPGMVSSGLLGPQTWCALEIAVARAEMAALEWPPEGAAGDSGWGACLLWRDATQVGFCWSSPDSLTERQQELVCLLEQVRGEAWGPDSLDPRLDPIPVVRLLHGYAKESAVPGEFLLRDEDALLDLLRQRLGRGVIVLPEVDFTREMVLAIFLGGGGSEAFDIRVGESAIRTAEDYLQVPVTLHRLAEGCPDPGGQGGDFDLVRLPKIDGEVFFLWDEIEHGCVGQ
ncbi:MAG: hypothetical protein KAY24_03390 [Candidatus Eisenbacteria sp.]|nr:hypothetical protein [Candidatus Eisenbacteria bacterium]